MPLPRELIDLPARLPAMRDCLSMIGLPDCRTREPVRNPLRVRVLGPVHSG